MATRYLALDSDEERLPEGMERTGYDADTQQYTYRDNTDGSTWQGEPGSRYGVLRRANTERITTSVDYAEETTLSGGVAGHSDWRYMFPFFVLVGVFLLAVFYLLPSAKSSSLECPQRTEVYRVRTGDTCWDIAKQHGVTVQELANANGPSGGLDCERLLAGQEICVPV